MVEILISSMVFRFAAGAMIFCITWRFASQANGDYRLLAFILFCSSFPAMLVPMFMRAGGQRKSGRALSVTAIGLIAVACIAGTAAQEFLAAWILLSFVLWLLFYVLDASFDMWLAAGVSGLTASSAQKAIGKFSMYNQLAEMLGPLVAAGIMVSSSDSYLLAGLALVMLVLFIILKLKTEDAGASPIKCVGSQTRIPMALRLMLILLWPIVSAVSFTLPVTVSETPGWGGFHLAVLEAFFGAAMACAGIVAGRWESERNACIGVFYCAAYIVGSLAAWAHLDQLVPRILMVVGLGFALGSMRVVAKTLLLRSQPEASVGHIVAQCNGVSVWVTAFFLLMQVALDEYSGFVPFAQLLLVCLLAFMLISKRGWHQR
ncbi:hypothetical protein [Pseudomonas putida]